MLDLTVVYCILRSDMMHQIFIHIGHLCSALSRKLIAQQPKYCICCRNYDFYITTVSTMMMMIMNVVVLIVVGFLTRHVHHVLA